MLLARRHPRPDLSRSGLAGTIKRAEKTAAAMLVPQTLAELLGAAKKVK